MVGGHHQFNRHEFEQTPGDGERQGSQTCCSPCSCRELNMTERLNDNNTVIIPKAQKAIITVEFLIISIFIKIKRKLNSW